MQDAQQSQEAETVAPGAWSRGFIGVDWGTTNRRAYRIDASGAVIDQIEDDQGVRSMASAEFRPSIAALRSRLGPQPLLMAGMVGSNRGWIEAPYVRCPAQLSDLVESLAWTGPDVAIVPGVADAQADDVDVMRGEEVQLFGALALGLPAIATVCHPGTHTKWVRMQDGGIQRFRTIMTGELFSLLKEHSILGDLLQQPAVSGDAFLRGVGRGFDSGELSAELFRIRAEVLLGTGDRSQAASYASGLLIGCDVRAGLRWSNDPGPIVVLGRPSLTALYGEALEACGRKARELDGAEAFIAGLTAIARRIT